jgi:segregation and condensation protein B
MRGVSPAEVEAAIVELNQLYEADATPYAVVGSTGGYRLALRESYQRVRDKFLGRVRESRLSPAAMEVLAVVAYKQPATATEVSELRGHPSGSLLASLVRQKLLQQERPADGSSPRYVTTERFLRLFRLESLAALPEGEQLHVV